MSVEQLSRPATAIVDTRRSRLILGLSWALVGVSIAYGLGFLVAAYFRLTYAYPLAAMEQPGMQAVRRILDGQPLYGAPSLEYAPTIYTPLYFYVSALAARVLGADLLTLRLVSLLASLGSTLLIGHLVWRETRNLVASFVAGGLFVCSTALVETTLDLARVDALNVCLMLASLDLARAADASLPRRGTWLSVASGVVIGLAILTKQTAVAVALVLAAHSIFGGRPARVLAFLLGAGLVVGVAAAVLVAQYGAWPALYLVDLPRQHALELQRIEGFWSRQVLPGFSLPVVALPVFLLGRALRRDFVCVRFWVLVTLGMLAMAWGASLNQWSGNNVLMPAFAVLSAGFGLGLAEGLERLAAPVPQVRAFRAYLLALGLVQFAFLHYNPRETSPLRSDVESSQRFVAAIGGLPGVVFAPEFPELAVQAGKQDAPFGLSLGELQGIFGGKPRPQATAWTTAYAQALDERRFDEVLLETDGVLPFLSDTTRDHGYVDAGPLIPAGDEFYRLGGHYLPSLHVWVPRERAGRAAS